MSEYDFDDLRECALRIAWMLDDCSGGGFYACCMDFVTALTPQEPWEVLRVLFPDACMEDFEFRQSPYAPDGFWTIRDDANDCAEDFRLVFNEETGFVSIDVSGRYERMHELMRRFTGFCVMRGGAPLFNNDFHQED